MAVITFLLLIGGLAVSHCAETNAASVGDQAQRIIELQDENARLQFENLRLQMENSRLSLDMTKWRNQLEIVLKGPHASNAGEVSINERSKAALLDTNDLDGKSGSIDAAVPKNCAEVKVSGVYNIRTPPYLVYCDATTQGGNWTVIQRRMDGSVDFYRPWVDYRQGFGQLRGEFFIGLENVHLLTTYEPQELLIVMEDFEQQRKHAQYKLFEIGSENELYALQKLGAFSGDAGDSLRYHKSKKFSTYDRNNNNFTANCAQEKTGAWWYHNCHSSNLNGRYLRGDYPSSMNGQGVVWITWRQHHYSLKFVEMMIRPVAK